MKTKVLNTVFRFVVGLLFIFSGFVKAIDPIGTSIKLQKYFTVWGSFFDLFKPLSLTMSFTLVTAEMILGFALLLLYKLRMTMKVLLGLIAFFTLLTFYTAITGDPKDCGCFGDAIALTPWQSFGKDVILLFMIVYMTLNQKYFSPKFDNRTGHILMAVISAACIWFSMHNIRHLPVIDFRSFAEGSDIMAKTKDGVPPTMKYVLEKDGEVKKIDSHDNDAFAQLMKNGWKYKDSETVDEGEPASLHDFSVLDKEGNEIRDEILQGKSLLINIRKPDKVSQETINEIVRLQQNLSPEIKQYLIFSVGYDEVKTFLSESKLKGTFASMDEDINKAMIRANTGFVLIHDGVVADKWHINDDPSAEDMNKATVKQ